VEEDELEDDNDSYRDESEEEDNLVVLPKVAGKGGPGRKKSVEMSRKADRPQRSMQIKSTQVSTTPAIPSVSASAPLPTNQVPVIALKDESAFDSLLVAYSRAAVQLYMAGETDELPQAQHQAELLTRKTAIIKHVEKITKDSKELRTITAERNRATEEVNKFRTEVSEMQKTLEKRTEECKAYQTLRDKYEGGKKKAEEELKKIKEENEKKRKRGIENWERCEKAKFQVTPGS
jgi:hypothetical protein